MDSHPVSVAGSQGDASTAPTTPEGSLSFSPVIHATQGTNGVDDGIETSLNRRSRRAIAASGVPTVDQIRRICCVGAGYVGGPTAAVMAFYNPSIRVTVVDKDEGRIRRWNSSHPPIYEPGLREILRVARDGFRQISINWPTSTEASGTASDVSTTSSECESQGADHRAAMSSVPARQPNLVFSTQVVLAISEADIILIAVNTPTKSRGSGAYSATDMTAFEAVTTEVAQHARPGAIIVEKSTVPCRTSKMVQDTLTIHRKGVKFEILSNPEFLSAGTAVNDLLRPDRVLIGSNTTPTGTRAAELLAGIYAAWVPHERILTTNLYSSELAKLVANSMLAQRISSINSISAICERTGADVDEVANSIGWDPRIGNKFLKAGIGFGGSCFKKDILSLVYLAESEGLDEVAEYWRQVVKMNEYQRDRFTKRVIKCLNNTLTGKKIAVLGYAFKPNTSDTRESPAFEIIKLLLDEGPREIAVFDPCCNPLVIQEEIQKLVGVERAFKQNGGPVVVYDNGYEACDASDAILITTEFDEFRSSSHMEPHNAPPVRSPKQTFLVRDSLSFERPAPSELDLASHKFAHAQDGQAASPANPANDPVERFVAEPPCAADCPDCVLEAASVAAGHAFGLIAEGHSVRERLDWVRVAYRMREPKWVFDGRGVLELQDMAKLGVRLESVGRKGRG